MLIYRPCYKEVVIQALRSILGYSALHQLQTYDMTFPRSVIFLETVTETTLEFMPWDVVSIFQEWVGTSVKLDLNLKVENRNIHFFVLNCFEGEYDIVLYPSSTIIWCIKNHIDEWSRSITPQWVEQQGQNKITHPWHASSTEDPLLGLNIWNPPECPRHRKPLLSEERCGHRCPHSAKCIISCGIRHTQGNKWGSFVLRCRK